MKRSALLILVFLAMGILNAQTVYRFNSGLVVSSGTRYGREALYTDPLAWQLYNNAFKAPVTGGEFGVNEKGDKLSWRELKADTAGRFRFFPRRETQGTSNPFLNPGSVDRGADYLYLTYQSQKEQVALLHIQGNSGLYFNGAPHMGDPYSAGYLYIPVILKKGLNELLIRGANLLPEIIFPAKQVFISAEDATLPYIVLGQPNNALQVAVVLINASNKPLKNYRIKTRLAGKEVLSTIANVPALATRKVIAVFDGSGITEKGKYDCNFVLLDKDKTIDEKNIAVDAVTGAEQYASTFTSDIDGSLQYYAVTPQLNGSKTGAALFLSVHGAGVEAIGQARAYQSKDWGTLVAATNRRPRGFNWEDWGRLDALEVLAIAKKKFEPDPQRIYLTGHSMGGHGTWFLGATYPDKWAAIAPCAGYPTLKDYGSADGKIPDSSKVPAEQLLLRAGNQSDVPKLATNYQPLGIYILHGDSDRVVPVMYARQMKKQLAGFHKDFSYYEYPGGEHWFGNQSVDWKPLFDYFKWHARLPDSSVNEIDFMTSSPGISSSFRWATIGQQEHPLQYSRIQLKRNRKKNTISGSTQNIRLLKIDLSEFSPHTMVTVTLDSSRAVQYETAGMNDSIYIVNRSGQWLLSEKPALSQKNPLRYGTFKEAFNHRVVLVYGTRGNKEENETNYNKAMYDAESWYYRGNGAFDIVSDKEYASGDFKGRNIVLYGNATSNAAWKGLLTGCPIQVSRGAVKVADREWKGDDIGAYFIWPQQDPLLSVGVVAATGSKGMKAAYANQYFAGGSGFPDFMIFSVDMLKGNTSAIKMAGFFDNDWKLNEEEYVIQP